LAALRLCVKLRCSFLCSLAFETAGGHFQAYAVDLGEGLALRWVQAGTRGLLARGFKEARTRFRVGVKRRQKFFDLGIVQMGG
jgi:hypothetical protein